MLELNEAKIRSQMSSEVRGARTLSILECIDSTNAEALRHVAQSESGSVWIAEQQSAGRGRRGKRWISPNASNLYFSMLWKFAGEQSQLGGLSLVVGVVLARVLQSIGVSGVQLKWPNDVLVARQKLAGILVEMHADKAGHVCLVIGIGLNVNMAAESKSKIDQPWIDLASLLDSVPDRNSLAAQLIDDLTKSLVRFEEDGFSSFASDWKLHDVLEGRQVNVLAGEQSRVGTAVGVQVDGALRLQTPQGIEPIYGGEVSVRLAEGAV